ncbi:MAG: hypothetical protein Fur0010_14870 [Bdellovibrio sp.]
MIESKIYRKLLNFGSWRWNIQSGDLSWSDEIEPIFGMKPGEFKRTYEAFIEIVHPDDRVPLQNAVDQSIKDRTQYKIEHRIVWPDGSIHWVEEMGSVFYSQDGTPIEMIGTVKNIDNLYFLKETIGEYKAALQDKETFISAILKGLDAHSLVSITDREGTILHANQKFCDISGYTMEELIGQNHRIVNSGKHTNAFWKNFWNKILSGEMYTGLIFNKGKYGNEYIVNTTVIPLANNGNIDRFISIRTDVTELLRSQAQIREYQTNLEAMVEAKTKELKVAEEQLIHSAKMASLGVMSTGLAHELNNPLFLIQGFCGELKDIISREGKLSSDQAMNFLNEIEENSERMRVLIKSIKDFGYKHKEGFEKLSMKEVVEKSVSIIEKRLKVADINLRINVKNDFEFRAIPGRIEQVLINLLINAKDAIEEQGHSSLYSIFNENKGQIVIVIDTDDNYNILRVSDSGCGMNDEVKAKIFDPFFTTKPVNKGTGLGLSIIYSIIEEIKGQIHVDSEVGLGTTFEIKIPKITEE